MAKLPTQPHMETSLRVPDIAKRLDCTTAYIYKVLKSKQLAGRMDKHGEWLVDESALQAWLASKRTRRGRRLPASEETISAQPHAEAADSPNGIPPARRRAEDIFPTFRLVMGNPGDFVKRIDDLFLEMRSVRRLVEDLIAASGGGDIKRPFGGAQ